MLRFSVLLAGIFFPFLVSAHGDRPSLEGEVGPYLIDIGYDREGFRPGEDITFDIDLYTAGDRPQFVSYDSIDIRVMQDDRTVYSAALVNDPVYIPSFTYAFPESGDYSLSVAYVESGAVKTEATFNIAVSPYAGAAGRSATVLYAAVALLLLGLSGWFIVRSYRRQSRT